MPTPSRKKPIEPPHPGFVLRDYLKRERISFTKVADAIDLSRQNLNEILHGRTRINASVALGLSAALGTSAEFWLTLQLRHDLWRLRKDSMVKAYIRSVPKLTKNLPAHAA